METREPKENGPDPQRVGMVLGAIGGVVGFLVSLLGSLAGIVAAAFIGFSCGRRAAAVAGKRSGTASGLLSGVIAAPLYVMGATAGAIVTARQVGAEELAASTVRVAESLGAPELRLTAEEAWNFFLVATAISAVIQAGLLIGVSVATAAWISRKK